MSDFSKYIAQFSNSGQGSLTHVAFNKGKYHVPDDRYVEFYKTYYTNLLKGEKLFIIEQIKNSKFAYFVDIDSPKQNTYEITMNDVIEIMENIKLNIVKMFKVREDGKELENVVSKRTINMKCSKFHLNFPNLIVTSNIANELTKRVIGDVKKLRDELGNAIDISVYRTGLRLFGSEKTDTVQEKENFGDRNYERFYRIIENNVKINIKDTTFEMFKRCIIRRKCDVTLTELKENISKETFVKAKVVSVHNNELGSLLEEVCELNSDEKLLEFYNLVDVGKVSCHKNNNGMFCYYINIKGNECFCPFKNRSHKRESCPIYLELNSEGLFVRCYDSDCKTERYVLKMPLTFKTNYPELYLSINNKYWKSEVDVTPHIRKHLEESLNMSHYKIAKVAFNIYKDRFRIDDIKNTDWYEFDGNKWAKSHNMNILISEELKKYYITMKVDPENEDIDNKDKQAQTNIRNDIIDNIIKKLENVTFKKSVLNEMYYLFKSYDPDFTSRLDADPYLLGFKNGVYDFSKSPGTFRRAKPEDYITFSTGYEYTEYDESCNEVKEIYEFLEKIIPNQKVLEYLLKVLGRSLLGIPDEHFYIFTGSGANGKSTLFNILEDALKDYNTAVDVALLTNNRALSSAASPDVFRTKGKRQLTFAEPEYGQTLKTGLMKAFTGGDSIVSRELYKAPVTFKLQASLFLACNDLPNLSSIDGGTIRRIRVVEFKSRFCDSPNPKKKNEFHIDPDVKQKSRKWRPYFMSILIHYYNVYVEEMKKFGKIEEPEEVKIATNKYKNDNDKFNDFFEECVTYNEKYTVLNIRTIHGLFSTWWNSNNVSNKVPEIKELMRAMKLKYDVEDMKGFRVKVVLRSIESNIEDDF